NAMLFQYLGDDVRHAELLEDALVQPMRQVGQLGHQRQAVACQALTGFALGDAMDHPMDPTALVSECEEGRLVQQGFEVQVGVFADQLEIESVGLTDGLAAAESEHLQVMLETFDGQREMGLVGGGEHACSSWINPLIGAWRGEGCRCTTETPLWNAGSAHSRAA